VPWVCWGVEWLGVRGGGLCSSVTSSTAGSHSLSQSMAGNVCVVLGVVLCCVSMVSADLCSGFHPANFIVELC
jgi:hypothetical protein